MEVGYRRKPVLEVIRIEQATAASDVEHDRDPRLLGLSPDRVEAHMARRVAAGAGGRNQKRLASHLDGLFRHRLGPGEIGQGYIAGSQQSAVDGAEVQHRPVVGAGQPVGEVEVVASLRRQQRLVGEGIEDELAREAQKVESPAAVLLEEGSRGLPVLAQHDLVFVAGPVRGVAVLTPKLIDEGLLAGLHRAHVDRLHSLADRGIGVGKEPVGLLHDVGVGVVKDPAFSVGHGSTSCSRGSPGAYHPLGRSPGLESIDL